MGRHFAGSGRTGPHATHVGALDGLRGAAVVAVVAYHLGIGWARGGFLGVDAFLVLSGYLITDGLLRESDRSGRIDLGAFWARRCRRLLPALLVLLAAAALWAAVWALPDQQRSLRLDAASALGFVSNWRFVLSSQGYFGQSAPPSLLRHTWSLGVEAQLYLVWPVVVVLVCRWGRRWLAPIAAALACGSALLGAVVVDHGGLDRAYYGTDTRAVAFLGGACVAAGVARRVGRQGTRLLNLAGPVAAALTCGAWAVVDGGSSMLFRGVLAMAAVTGALTVASVVTGPGRLLDRVLSWPPLRTLGRVSYGIYLWHWPLIVVLSHRRTGLGGPALTAVRLAAIAGATCVSWLAVERPVLAVGPLRLPRRWQPVTALVTCAAVAAAVALPAGAGGARPSLALVPPSGPMPGMTHAALGPASALVLGDSVAVTLADAVRPFGSDYSVDVHDGAIVGCGVVTGTVLRSQGDVGQVPSRCQTWERDWQASVDSRRPDAVVVLLGRWEVLDRVVAGQWAHLGQPAFDAYVSERLDRALTIAGSGGARVVLCTTPYFQGQERPQGGTWPENEPSRVDRFNGLVRDAAVRNGVVLYDLNRATAPSGRYAAVLDGVAVRAADGVHFGPDSGTFLAPRLFPVLAGSNRPEFRVGRYDG